MSSIDIPAKVCVACKKRQSGGLECFACGSEVERVESEAAHANKKTAWGSGKAREYIKTNATLAAATGQKWPSAGAVVVTGAGGAGKSTLVAEAAIDLARQGYSVGVLDAEMGDDLARYTWRRAGATQRELQAVDRVTPDDGEWNELVTRMGTKDVVVVDSLHEWSELAPHLAAADCGRRGRLSQRSLVFVIAHFARAGHVHGSVKAEHRGDAVIVVTHDEIEVQKCTWAPRAIVLRHA